MTRIREIANVYAANASEVDHLAEAIADLVRDEREACAKIAAGFGPQILCQRIAAAIRARGEE